MADLNMSPCEPMDTRAGEDTPAPLEPASIGEVRMFRWDAVPATEGAKVAAEVPRRALPEPGGSAGLDPRERYDCAVGLLPGLAYDVVVGARALPEALRRPAAALGVVGGRSVGVVPPEEPAAAPSS